MGAEKKGFVSQLFLFPLLMERKSAGRICCAQSWKQNFPWLHLWRCGQSHSWGQPHFSPLPPYEPFTFTEFLEWLEHCQVDLGPVDFGSDLRAQKLPAEQPQELV